MRLEATFVGEQSLSARFGGQASFQDLIRRFLTAYIASTFEGKQADVMGIEGAPADLVKSPGP